MKYRALFIVLLFLRLATIAGAQEIEFFRPGARATGLGGSQVTQSRDPTALYWNPATLYGLKDQRLLLNVNDAFTFDYIGYSYFLPYYGTFSAALSRVESADTTDVNPRYVDRISVGWGRMASGPIHVGLSLNAEEKSGGWGYSSGVGFFVGNPLVGSHGVHWRNDHFTNFWDRVSLGVTLQNIPLYNPYYEFSVLTGFSLLIPEAGILLNTGYHLQKANNSGHLGIGYEILDRFSIMTGLQDLDWQKWGVNASYEHRHFVLDLGYSAELDNVLLTLAVRLGAPPRDRAYAHYERSRAYLDTKSWDKAAGELRKFLSFDLRDADSDTARTVLYGIIWQKHRNEFLADSLLLAANQFITQGEPQVLRAALLYQRVLEIDSENKLARSQLEILEPAIGVFVKNSISNGNAELEAGNYKEAETHFRRAELFDPHNETVKQSLARVAQGFREQAEEHFFRGIGYYRQKEYIAALKAFDQALEWDPELTEAVNYRKRTSDKLTEVENQVDVLQRDAFLLEEKRQFLAATQKYLEILDFDPNHEIARNRLSALKPQVARFVEQKYQLGVQAANVGDYPVAITHFRNVLAIDGEHQRARLSLQQARSDLKSQIESEMMQARIAEDNSDWDTALESYNYVVELEPSNRVASEGKKRAERYRRFTLQVKSARQKWMLRALNEAKREVEAVLHEDPDYRPALELRNTIMTEIHNKAENLFNRGLALFAEDEYQEAVTYWEQVLELVPDHALASDYIAQARERILALKKID